MKGSFWAFGCGPWAFHTTHTVIKIQGDTGIHAHKRARGREEDWTRGKKRRRRVVINFSEPSKENLKVSFEPSATSPTGIRSVVTEFLETEAGKSLLKYLHGTAISL